MSRHPRPLLLAAVLALLLVPAKASYATAFVFNVVVDTVAIDRQNVSVAGQPGIRIEFDADFPEIDEFFVTDTLHLDVSFAPGVSIRLIDLGTPFLGDDERITGRTILRSFRGSDRHDVYGFGGLLGTLLVNPFATDTFQNDVNLTNEAFSFSTLTLDLTFSNPLFDPALPIFRGLHGFGFEFWADDAEIVGAGTVPEPSSLLLVGLGVLALKRRLRHTVESHRLARHGGGRP
jgi:hypothetical protein